MAGYWFIFCFNGTGLLNKTIFINSSLTILLYFLLLLWYANFETLQLHHIRIDRFLY